MDYFKEFDFKTPKQQRGQKAIKDITDAITALSYYGKLDNITIRDLSERSGHPIGTIYHHFSKFDNVFVYIFISGRINLSNILVDVINTHSADSCLNDLISNMVNSFINQLSQSDSKTFLFVLSQFMKNTDYPHLTGLEMDILIPHLMKANQADKTGTIFKFNENELRLRLRAFQAIIESPYHEGNALARTVEHTNIAIDSCIQLFSAPVLRELHPAIN
jgi:AcrR family transcriptional regulator